MWGRVLRFFSSLFLVEGLIEGVVYFKKMSGGASKVPTNYTRVNTTMGWGIILRYQKRRRNVKHLRLNVAIIKVHTILEGGKRNKT